MRVNFRLIAGLSLLSLLSTQSFPAYSLTLNSSLLMAEQRVNRPTSSNRLPVSIAIRVREKAAEVMGVPLSRVSILNAERRTWPNGCLGLELSDILCTQARVDGWLVTVNSDGHGLLYRTDNRGEIVYLENGLSVLPASVQQAVFKAVQTQSRIPPNQLRVTQAHPRIWDGCLGIQQPGILCPQIAIYGWQVTVQGRGQRWVYNTNQNGTQVRFYQEASQENPTAGAIKPIPFPRQEPTPVLPRDVVFQAISSGGIAGRVSKVTLWSDGWITWQDGNGIQTPVIKQDWISPQQVQAFKQILASQKFSQYNRLDFPAPAGSADMITVTLIDQQSVTRYADFNLQLLPSSLRTVVTAWQQVISHQ